MEVLIERYMIAPVRLRLEHLVGSEDRPATVRLLQEDVRETPGKVVADLSQRELRAGAGGTLNQEIIAVIVVEPRSAGS
jgi:hypothetical protein